MEFKKGDYVYGKYGIKSYIEGYVIYVDIESRKIKIQCKKAAITLPITDVYSEKPESLEHHMA